MSHPTQDDLCQRAYPYDSPESVLSYRPDRACLDLSLPPVDTVFDLHGDPTVADLVILFNGNQFMVVEEFYTHSPSSDGSAYAGRASRCWAALDQRGSFSTTLAKCSRTYSYCRYLQPTWHLPCRSIDSGTPCSSSIGVA